jgi:hypothetical protein
MTETALYQIGGGFGGLGALVLLIRLVYVQWVKQNPGIQQAGASVDIYILLRKELKVLSREMRLMKKQVALLEHLCLEKGINVHEIYTKAGIFDEVEEDDDK